MLTSVKGSLESQEQKLGKIQINTVDIFQVLLDDISRKKSQLLAVRVTGKQLSLFINQKEEWDLILFVTPTGEYVDDGYRDQSMADDDSRKNFSEYLDSLRKIYHQDTNVVYLDGNYEENYKKAKAAIDQVYNFDL